ncbi:MAG: hypothetical protein QOI09_1059 [Chloroflexota bacterium]|nr:hypothetical protein [Chloroflexota bacterium]
MPSSRRFVGYAGVLAVAGIVSAIGAGPLFVGAADHLDAPTAKSNHRIDITDLYAFKSGAGTTLILNVNPLTTPANSKTVRFSTTALYEFKVDLNGDAVADVAYRVKFGSTRFAADGSVIQTYTVRRATGAAARVNAWTGTTIGSGSTTPYRRGSRVTTFANGTRAFAGVRDDPFFFDLVGFIQFKNELLMGNTTLGSPGGGPGSLLGGFTGSDTFAGTNVSSIALWVPNAALGGAGRHIGIWATTSTLTSTGFDQVDRMGRPAINTVFNGLHAPVSSTLNNAEKEAFNRINPTSDRAVATDNVVAVLDTIGAVLTANGATAYTATQVNGIARILLPDILTFQVGNSAGFLNGRKLGDDVINAEFSLLTNGAVTSDGVNANDRSFFTSFPYLAAPH